MDLPHRGRNDLAKGDAPLESIDTITSVSTHDLFDDLQNDDNRSVALELPQLPQLPTTPTLLTSRKRHRDEYLASSSDAPLFSSDDLPSSSADNYLEQRHKRQYQRSWFEPEYTSNISTIVQPGLSQVEKYSPSARTPRSRGPFTRAYDSGVWLGSDETDGTEDFGVHWDRCNSIRVENFVSFEGEDLELGDETCALNQTLEEDPLGILAHKAMQFAEDPGDFEGPVFPYWQKQPDNLQAFHFMQRAAQRKVFDCVDSGREDLDLSALELQRIRTPTLIPLRYYTKQVPSQGKGPRFQRLTPALRLYLSNNLLDEVPGEVYHLKNLEVLSLRCNNITEILPSISELVNLREINFGSNQLKWLPWEFHRFLGSKLKRCILHPNPFIRPIPSIWGVEEYHDFGDDYKGHLASTHIAFLDITGTAGRDYPPAPTSIPEHWAKPSNNEKGLRPPPEQRTKTPSLMELAIRACYRVPQLSQLPFLLPSDCPLYLRQLLQSTWKLKEAGGKKCSVCGGEYVIPRTEWIEWWFCIPTNGDEENKNLLIRPCDRMPMPFLRRGCSWQCFAEKPPEAFIRGWDSAIEPGGRKDGAGLRTYA